VGAHRAPPKPERSRVTGWDASTGDPNLADPAVDLHVYGLLLLRAHREPLRQWSGREHVDDDHTLI